MVWGILWPVEKKCVLKKLGVFMQVELPSLHYHSAKKPCITQEGPCPAGQYKPPGQRLGCKTCAAGTYSKAGATSCTKCPAGTYSSAQAASCPACPAGKYSKGGASGCATCPAGTYSGARAGKCLGCEAGYYSAAGAKTCSECYKSKMDNAKMSATGEAMSFEAAAAACFSDDKCGGVTCSKKGTDKCYLATGRDSSKTKKWYSYLKDC